MANSAGPAQGTQTAQMWVETQEVASSALMHIAILKAKLKFLQINNGLSDELKGAALSLTAGMSSDLKTESKVNKAGVKTEILQAPLIYEVLSDYVGPNVWHLVANKGDTVVVHGWSDKYATAYNPRTNQIGRILGAVIVKHPNTPLPSQKEEIVVSMECSSNHGAGKLYWKAWDHIRVCSFDKDTFFHNSAGVGFNMATGAFGRFQSSSGGVFKAA